VLPCAFPVDENPGTFYHQIDLQVPITSNNILNELVNPTLAHLVRMIK
jgi:hypothetical protein